MGLFFPRPTPAADAVALRDEATRLSTHLLQAAARLIGRSEGPAAVEAFCHAVVQATPHLPLAWVWFGAPDAPVIAPQIVAGRAAAYAHGLRIERGLLTRMGPAFRALAGERIEPFGVSASSVYGPWRRAAREHGLRHVVAVPLASTADDQRGIFVVYADRPAYFHTVGVGLFESLAHLFSAVLSEHIRRDALLDAARRDALTGLFTRHHLPMLAGRITRYTALDPEAAVLVVDVDHFKHLNDAHGHAAGDAALTLLAGLLRGCLRGSDTLLRWGGEEFVVGLPDTSQAAALRVAEKLRAAVEAATFTRPGGDAPALRLTVSIGLTGLRPGEPVETALDRADTALYAAKDGGRNRCVLA
jgi:diguanylate cyclase (GGDEF)-like protein